MKDIVRRSQEATTITKAKIFKPKMVKLPKKMSKRNIRLLERSATINRNIDLFLGGRGKLPYGVWLRGTDFKQKVPEGM